MLQKLRRNIDRYKKRYQDLRYALKCRQIVNRHQNMLSRIVKTLFVHQMVLISVF